MAGRAPTKEEFEAVRDLLKSIGSTDPLDKKEEFPLIQAAKAGDQEAMQRLIRAYIRFIVKQAPHYGPDTIPLQDRVMDGIEGLIDAVHRYDDPTGQTPLLAYAKGRIRMHMEQEERSYREQVMSAEMLAVAEDQARAKEMEHWTPDDDTEILNAGETTAIPVDAVKVGERIRKDPGDIEGLAYSMQRLGLLEPILVTKDLYLLAGWRRLLAAKQLGWTTILARVLPITSMEFTWN